MSSPIINKLANNLTVAADIMPDVETVSVNVLVKTGSRYEDLSNNGISHFLEHMAFKGTNTRTAQQIAEEFDNIGGYFNAYTSRERTVYYAKVLKDDINVAVDILADILQNSVFSEDEINKEKGVIAQEIAQNDDTPDEIIFDKFHEISYHDQPFGRSILGTMEFLERVGRKDIVDYVNEFYSFDNIIVSLAGKADAQLFNDLVADKFNNFSNSQAIEPEAAKYDGGDIRISRDLEQVHLVMGYDAVSFNHPEYYTQQVLSIILGGGMSSRLFQEIREKRGLVYNISSFGSSYSDSGVFGIYSSTTDDKVNEMIKVIAEELAKVTKFISEEELLRAKAQVRASLLMSRESTGARAEKLASNLASFGRYIPIDEIMDDINSITVNKVKQFSNSLFSKYSTLSLASIGKIDKLYEYDEVVKLLKL